MNSSSRTNSSRHTGIAFTLCRRSGIFACVGLLASVTIAFGQEKQAFPLPKGAIKQFGIYRFYEINNLTKVVVSPDGKTMAGCSHVFDPLSFIQAMADKNATFYRICLWEPTTGKLLRKLKLPLYNIRQLRFSPDGGRLAATEIPIEGRGGVKPKHRVPVFKVRTGKIIFQGDHPDAIQDLRFTPNGNVLRTIDAKGVVRSWDLRTGNLQWQTNLKTLLNVKKINPATIPVVRFSHDGRLLFVLQAKTAAALRKAKSNRKKLPMICSAFDLQQKRRLWQRKTTTPAIIPYKTMVPRDGIAARFCLAVSPDATSLAIAADTVEIVDARTGKLRRSIASKLPLTSFVFSPDGRYLLTKVESDPLRLARSAVTRLILWNVETGKKRQDFCIPDSETISTTPVFFPKSTRIAVVARPSVQFWDAANGKRLWPPAGHVYPVTTLTFSKNGTELLSESKEGERVRWNVPTGQLRNHVRLPETLRKLYWDKLYEYEHTWNVTLEEIFNGTQLDPMERFREYPLALAHQNKLGAFWTADGNIQVRHLTTQQKLARVPGPKTSIHRIAFSLDGKRLAITRRTKQTACLAVYDTMSGKLLNQTKVRIDPNQIGSGRLLPKFDLEFAPNGKTLIWGLDGYTALLVDIAAGKILHRFVTPVRDAYQLFPFSRYVYSSDGQLVALVSSRPDGDYARVVADLYDIRQSRLLRRIHAGRVPHPLREFYGRYLTISPDKRRLAIGYGNRQTIEFWEIASATKVTEVQGHSKPIAALAWSPDGRYVASGSQDTTIMLWDVAKILRADQRARLTPSSKDIAGAWKILAERRADIANRGQHIMVDAADKSVTFLAKHMHPVGKVSKQQVQLWLTQLDSRKFRIREKAAQKLQRQGRAVESALRAALKKKLTLETHLRIQKLLTAMNNPVATPEQLRGIRSVEVLEKIGTPAARRLLQRLAQGAPGVWLTEEARMSLARR